MELCVRLRVAVDGLVVRDDSFCPLATPGRVAAAQQAPLLVAAARADRVWTVECSDPLGRLEWRRSNREELEFDIDGVDGTVLNSSGHAAHFDEGLEDARTDLCPIARRCFHLAGLFHRNSDTGPPLFFQYGAGDVPTACVDDDSRRP